MPPISVFVSSRFRSEHARRIRALLDLVGFDVRTAPGHSGFASPVDLFNAIDAAEAVLWVCDDERGSAGCGIEVGRALTLGIPVLVVGRPLGFWDPVLIPVEGDLADAIRRAVRGR